MTEKRSTRGLSTRPVFVGGLMKSGTTVLRALLGQHHRLFGTFETHWFEDAVRFDWENPNSRRMQLILSLLEIDNDEYASMCEKKRADAAREFIDIVMEYCCKRAGKERWVEKTPGNILHWSLIQAIWSESSFIHVKREYKDTYASWKVRRRDSLETFLAAAKGAYDDIGPLLGTKTERYLEVDYVELVTQTEQTMRGVLAHIGEKWDPACAALNVKQTGGERMQFKELLGRESWTLVSLSKPIFTNSIGQWHRFVDKEEQSIIEKELAEYYKIWGDKWRNF